MKTGILFGLGLAFAMILPATAQAADLGQSLKGLSSSLDASSLTSGTASNAAGVIGYCVKNKYLGNDAAATVKDKLMDKLGLETEEPEADPGYQDGLGGLLSTASGERVDLSKFKDSFTRKACSAVLDHAGDFL